MDARDPNGRRATTDRRSGDDLSAVVDALVRQHKDFFGRGPTHARAFVSGDTLICMLEGGLTRAERALVHSGNVDAVIDQRAAAQRAICADVAREVEMVMQRGVKSFMSANDPEHELMCEIFVLEPVPDEPGNVYSEALGRDAERAQDLNRRALEDMRALRAEQVQSREALRRRRASMGEGPGEG